MTSTAKFASCSVLAHLSPGRRFFAAPLPMADARLGVILVAFRPEEISLDRSSDNELGL
jgi:hypothetical protein